MACGNSSIAKNGIAGRAYREGAPAELFDVPLPPDLIGQEPGCYGRLPPVVSGRAPIGGSDVGTKVVRSLQGGSVALRIRGLQY